MLTQAEEAFRKSANAWYDSAYTDPSQVDPTLFDLEMNPDSTCWFKADAVDLLDRIPPYLTVLAAHGVTWRKCASSRPPGRILYEDEWQIVVVPSPERPQ
jgi:hypothetical protein